MLHGIAEVPTSFVVEPFAAQWFRWPEVAACFWPGSGGRANAINPLLAGVRYLGGVYCLSWSSHAPALIGPLAPEVKYIGESGEFLRRIGQFGESAGFFHDGKRRDGHSAAWR